MRTRGIRVGLPAAACAIAAASAADAGETIRYGYDVHGRLIRVDRGGSAGGSASARYSYDAADNRTNLTVSVPGPPPPPPPNGPGR